LVVGTVVDEDCAVKAGVLLLLMLSSLVETGVDDDAVVSARLSLDDELKAEAKVLLVGDEMGEPPKVLFVGDATGEERSSLVLFFLRKPSEGIADSGGATDAAAASVAVAPALSLLARCSC
jgi:hypothetical protein